MKITRPYPAFTVSGKAEKALRAGHPWVYAEEISEIAGEVTNGGIADVFSSKGSYLGSGLISLESKIRVRILSRNANDRFDKEFFARRVRYAIDYRHTVMGKDFDCCRLIFGEADGLPGVTVDKYGDILVTQILSFGMEQRRNELFTVLAEELKKDGVPVRGIFQRNDVAIRNLEGLDQYKGWYGNGQIPLGTETDIIITENGLKYAVDIENGQKTGFFLDQKYNRLAAAKIAGGKKVLDCFTHTGSFAMNAVLGGASHVTAVDVSQSAIDLARSNARLNGIEDRMDFVCADVFDLLPELCREHKDYDMIILDPPAFTKSRKTVAGAERGYKEINYRAMKLLPRGGYLATASCSHFMPNDLFIKMINSAAADADVQLKLVELRRQAPDHPTLMSVPETDYLKFYIFQLV